MPKHMRLSKQILRRSTVIGATIASAAVIAACSSDSVAAGNAQTQLAFGTNSGLTAATLDAVTVGAHTLNLTSVTLTVDRAELKRAHTDACEGDHDEDDDSGSATTATGPATNCSEVKLGPTTVALPLTPGVVTLPADAIPAGTFREFELSVSQAEVKGTFDGGTPFDVVLPVRVRQEVDLDTPLVVTDGTPVSVTVNVSVNDWFTNADGSLIDPSTVLANPSVLARVKARIRASFRAFEDDDHDGKEDHGGHGR
jgi:hypothetical protein